MRHHIAQLMVWLAIGGAVLAFVAAAQPNKHASAGQAVRPCPGGPLCPACARIATLTDPGF